MKSIFLKRTALLCAMFLSVGPDAVIAQTALQSQDMDMKLSGTSNLHDWEMIAVKGTSKAAFIIDAKGKVVSMTRLSFFLPCGKT